MPTNFFFCYCKLAIKYKTPVIIIFIVNNNMLCSFLFLPIMCYYLLSTNVDIRLIKLTSSDNNFLTYDTIIM